MAAAVTLKPTYRNMSHQRSLSVIGISTEKRLKTPALTFFESTEGKPYQSPLLPTHLLKSLHLVMGKMLNFKWEKLNPNKLKCNRGGYWLICLGRILD